jgi:hypothetical protein
MFVSVTRGIFVFCHHTIVLLTYVQLVAKKNGSCQNKIDTFLQFFHGVKHLLKLLHRYCQVDIKLTNGQNQIYIRKISFSRFFATNCIS